MTENSIPDQGLIASITPDVMRCLEAKMFFALLDDRLCPVEQTVQRTVCQGDHTITKQILQQLRFDSTEVGDILDVLLRQGGCCDCEILYNVVDAPRLKAKYWRGQAEGGALSIGHHGGNQE